MRFLLLLLLCGTANAATYYRDRYLPGGVCMVKFGDGQINAALIQETKAGTFQESSEVKTTFWEPPRWEWKPYTAFRVTLANGKMYEVRGDLPQSQTMEKLFLQNVKEQCQ